MWKASDAADTNSAPRTPHERCSRSGLVQLSETIMDDRTQQLRRAMLAACGIADRPGTGSRAAAERLRSRDRMIAQRFAAISTRQRGA